MGFITSLIKVAEVIMLNIYLAMIAECISEFTTFAVLYQNESLIQKIFIMKNYYDKPYGSYGTLQAFSIKHPECLINRT